MIKNENENPVKVNEVLKFVDSKKGIDYARNKMFELRDEAFSILNEFKDSTYKQSMKDLITFTTNRSY